MNFYVVIPAHNEEDSISLTIESLARQTLLPKKVVIVNDNSSDTTKSISQDLTKKYPWLTLVNTTSEDKHLPGAKIINAFYKGFEVLDEEYDVICKFDADLIFPENYLEKLANHFNNNPKLGMAAGFCYIKKGDAWVIESLTGKDHIRGALKAYRKACFLDIGKLKSSMGWDTVDELLAKYYNWEIMTDGSLHVKHLKPTGASYNKASKLFLGEAMYKIRQGFLLTCLTATKVAFKKKSFKTFKDYILGYLDAKKRNVIYLVNKDQGKFIRKTRWKGILRIK